ncbi:RagB/SusD family nutrient uptake outer membrane protein [Owenweeksia hongkongensis]|uniref:RagB/SusD family protein n=1 Tax=Owenweeksia hongkongensis (strain DSM 17368 / CIP 108786 / JCM 12287 / NRRL B-23963 / UST20020801) TaxID=926562 RepID=G8R4Q9_OWEHD|nr:RagB/SusD family nutrient uptake outer membrane protein [Owenweeksia hongkongensis]AEV33183.1 RagB/SusD family protein [Owenweeksia hongkongensis DSM 17368]
MKAIKYITLGLILAVSASCEKFLELEPESELTAEGYYEDAEQIESGLYACYDGLQQTIQIEFILTEMRSDNGTTVLNEGGFGQLDKFNDATTNNYTLNYWQLSYNTIMRANTVLKYLDVVTDAGQRSSFEGEARLIRAINYFNLVRLYGAVPLVDDVILSSEDEFFKRVDEATIYNFIKSDLQFAAQSLPATSDAGRPNLYTAMTLLGKVHLTLKEYSDAKIQLGNVINMGGYALEPNYEDVFSISNELNDEIIMAIEFKENSNGEGQSFSHEMTIQGEFGGLNNPTTDFINSAAAEDSIRTSFLITNDSPPLCGKYLSSANPLDAGNDWPLLRYADVLLMYGEAENELNGPTQDALDYLNETRNRAGLSSLTTTDITTADEYRTAMEEERRYELAFENHRWFDLLRTGRAFDVMNAQGATEGFSVPTYRLLYPIPQREIDVSNGLLTQNSGY